MRRLRERQRELAREAEASRRRLAEDDGKAGLMSAALGQRQYEDSIKARWHGGPSVLAFLFAPPDSQAMHMLDARGDYFDVRTSNTWDLFFPGYFKSPESTYFERQTGAEPIGYRYGRDWYFHPREFNELRRHVERSSGGRWRYSGGADLVLVNVYLVERGEPAVDWESTISGQVADGSPGGGILTLANVVERITHDFEAAVEDPAYGVGDLVNGASAASDHPAMRDFMVNALGGIAAALGARAMGL